MGPKRNKIIFIIDILLTPFTYLSAVLLGVISKIGVQRMRLNRKIFRIVGVLPIRDHYYEPLFNPKHLRYSLRKYRILPGIDLNIKEQLEILNKFNYNEELSKFPLIQREFPACEGGGIYGSMFYAFII